MPSQNSFDCDVLIVGGGPAGSTCAKRLIDAGLDAVIMDRATFPRDKVCAGWITPPVVEELGLDLDEYRRQQILQPIQGFRTGVLDGPMVETNYGETVSYAIRRCEFDAYLLKCSGARTLEGTPLKTAERTDDGWLINGSIRARFLVGAGGHFCPVARLINPQSEPPGNVVLAQEVEFALSETEASKCTVTPELPELYFYGDLKGYAWVVRKQHFLNIGLGRMGENAAQSEGLSAFREQFLEKLIAMGRIGSKPPQPFRGHAYRIYRATNRRVLDDRVLLIGDAAGLAVPQSGEGIRPAIESGLLAAQILSQAAPDFPPEKLRDYEHELQVRFGRRGCSTSSESTRARLRAAIARRLLRTHWFTRHILLNRWFLQRHIGTL